MADPEKEPLTGPKTPPVVSLTPVLETPTPSTALQAGDNIVLLEQLREFAKEEERLLEGTLAEHRRSDQEWSQKLKKVIGQTVTKQKDFEIKISKFRSVVDSQQNDLKKVVSEVKDLMEKYPQEFIDHTHEQIVMEADEAADNLDLACEASENIRFTMTKMESQIEMDYFAKVRGKSTLGRLVCSTAFDGICTFVIAINAVYIGISVEYSLSHIGEKKATWQVVAEILFYAFYLVELILKLTVHKLMFFVNPEWTWNIFDFLLVLSATYDLLNEHAKMGGMGADLMWMRLLRLLKMMKLMRMVRVMRFFRELRLMMSLIGQSLRSLFWALLMLGLIMYLFGLCFLQAVTNYLREKNDIDPEVKLAIEKYWDSVYDAVATLLMAITRGIDWRDASKPLEEVGQIYHILFLLYISFTMFAVLNILTGIFVEASYSTVASDRASVASEALNVTAAQGNKLLNLLQQWCNTPDLLSEEAFLKACTEDEGLKEIITEMEIQEEEIVEMFRDLAKVNHVAGMVRTKDLSDALMKLKGPAQAMDVVQLTFGCGKYNEAVENFMHFVEEQLLNMRRALQYRLHHHSSYVMPLSARLKAARSMPVRVFSL